jgi:hypothetical protein
MDWLLSGREVPNFIKRLPVWLRWVLMIPAAVAGDLISQSLGRIFLLITGLPSSIFNPLIWHVFAPIVFILWGTQVAPSHKLEVFVGLCIWRIIIAGINIGSVLNFIEEGGKWTSYYKITDSPIWWETFTEVIILLLLSYYLYSAISKRSK